MSIRTQGSLGWMTYGTGKESPQNAVCGLSFTLLSSGFVVEYVAKRKPEFAFQDLATGVLG